MRKTAKVRLGLWACVLLGLLVLCRIANAADVQETARVDVILWFDTEDYLLPADDDAAELLNVNLHSFDSAVERALAEWEASEPLAAR